MLVNCVPQRRLFSGVALIFGFVLWANAAIPLAHAGSSDERSGRIRAAAVYYVAKFVTWPSGAMAEGQSPIRICSAGDDPAKSYLEETVRAKKIRGRSIDVHVIEDLATVDLKPCHILFLGKGPHTLSVLSRSRQYPILSICGVERVRWGSCAVQLFTEQNKLRIAVDLDLTSEAGIRVDSELLGVALVNGNS